MNKTNICDILPFELCDIIFSFIPDYNKIRLNKTYFQKYHHLIKSHIINNKTEDYIRNMLRQDCDFIFFQLLQENHFKWNNLMRNYYYDTLIFSTYIDFIAYYCDEHESHKCKSLIDDHTTY